MSTQQLNYFLVAGETKIPVGSTKPYFSQEKKGWVTENGIFSTMNPSSYTVQAVNTVVSETTETTAVTPPVAPTVTATTPSA